MNLKKIIIIIIIFVCASAGIFFVSQNIKRTDFKDQPNKNIEKDNKLPSGSNKNDGNSAKNNINNISERDKIKINNKIYADAKKNLDVNACGNMLDKTARDMCVKLIAIDAKKPEWCARIADKKMKEECGDYIIYNKASAAGDVNLCEEMADANFKNSCMVNIISDKNYSKEDCGKLEKDKKDLCLSYVLFNEAKATNNKELCGQLPLADYIEECLGMF